MRFKFVLAALAAAAATLTQAAPLQVFESAAATGSSSRSAGSGILTRFQVSATTRITNLAIEMDLASAGNVKYYIWNSITGALLYESAFKAFADDGMSFKLSDAFSFDLMAGTRYAIGALADVGSRQNYVVPGALTIGNISSLGGNQNMFSYAFSGGIAGTDGRIRLFTDDAHVPEPGSVLLVGLGLLAAGAVRRKSA